MRCLRQCTHSILTFSACMVFLYQVFGEHLLYALCWKWFSRLLSADNPSGRPLSIMLSNMIIFTTSDEWSNILCPVLIGVDRYYLYNTFPKLSLLPIQLHNSKILQGNLKSQTLSECRDNLLPAVTWQMHGCQPQLKLCCFDIQLSKPSTSWKFASDRFYPS